MVKKMNETSILTTREIKLKTIHIEVSGLSTLIIHNWSEKSKKEMRDIQFGNKAPKKLRNIYEDFIESLYWIKGKPNEYTMEAFNEAVKNGAEFGIKATSFKLTMTAAGYRNKITKDRVSLSGAIFIKGNENDLLKINGIPEMQEDMVKLSNGNADLRYRGVFKRWSVILPITYNSDIIELEQIVNLINLGGFCCGVGDWRVEKKGQYGMFKVDKVIKSTI